MKKLFGTDGIRAVAGQSPLDTRTVYAVGLALAHHLGQSPRVLLGMDTRESSTWIAATLTAGLDAGGASVENAGVITTPAVAYLTQLHKFSAGIVISASHNPWEDNGIKLFGPDGFKLPDSTELAIEAEIFRQLEGFERIAKSTVAAFGREMELTDEQIDNLVATVPETITAAAESGKQEVEIPISSSPQVGLKMPTGFSNIPTNLPTPETAVAPAVNESDRAEYIRFLLASVPDLSLANLTLVIDCANGAASAVAPQLFAELASRHGGETHITHSSPTGRNINEHCGALHPDIVAKEVVAQKASLGITFDGDADRALFADHLGNVVNGDAVLLLAARDLQSRGQLANATVVATTMSNMGLEAALKRSSIAMLRANVGDKYVLEQMLSTGASLGGEQSGHIIFNGRSTTGDGILTALLLLDIVHRSGKSLADLTADLKVFPQVIVNVKVREKKPLDQIPTVVAAIAAAEHELADTGRVVIRYSGTEALARVMIEAESELRMRHHAEAIAQAIRTELGV
jgi:phosphoglucosamine mutase